MPSCNDIRAALAECLQNSDCVMVHRNKPADCLRPPLDQTLPFTCLQLRHGYGDCKRGLIDMRKRFRGHKPVASSVELEAGASAEERGMLYAGKGSYEGADPRGTSGRDMESEGLEKFVRNDGIEDVRRKA